MSNIMAKSTEDNRKDLEIAQNLLIFRNRSNQIACMHHIDSMDEVMERIVVDFIVFM